MRLVDFYKKNNIIPVVNLGDVSLKKILKQRDDFYRTLSIYSFENKSVLELCPGTGVNAFYLLNEKIKNITLVDINPQSILQMKNNLNKYSNKKIYSKDIYKFDTNKKFDYVIIECVLAGMDYPDKILKKLPKYLKKNGVLIFTLTDECAYISEKARGLISKILISEKEKQKKKKLTFIEKYTYLSKIFDSHLNTLGPNTKKTEKWIQDNMLQYDWWGKKKYLSLEDSLKPLNIKRNKLSFWSISPQINNSFLWYKNRSNSKVNDIFINNYRMNKINFIDVRQKYFNTKNIDIQKLLKIVNNISLHIFKISSENKAISKAQLRNIINSFNKLKIFLSNKEKNNKTVKSLASLISFLENYSRTNKIKISLLNNFKGWWGHGTKQISLIKNKDIS